MTTEALAPQSDSSWILERFRGDVELYITPIFFAILAAAAGAVWFYSDFDFQTADILEPSKLVSQTWEHMILTFWSTLIVLLIAIPLGILLTRPAFRKYSGPVLGLANGGQAVPAYGLLVLFAAWLGTDVSTAVVALTVFSILPVLRNTMVGLDQVDQAVIEAGRGMGLSKLQVLRQIELPLAVPVILAGIRIALVINVGTAALAFLIGAGGLGETINSGLKLRRDAAVFIGGSLVAMLALVIDFTAALAERYMRPSGV